MELTEKIAVVSGAASGLGLACCQTLLDSGAKVLALDVNEEALHGALGSKGDRVRLRVVDVAHDGEVVAAVAEALDVWGALHVAVNCAGILGPCRTLSKGEVFPFELWNRVIGVNLTGTFNVVRHAAKAMALNEPNADGERGVIISTASGAAWQGQVGQAAYSASKAGVMGLTLPVARDLAPLGIRVVTIAPGLFETGMSAGMRQDVFDRLIDQTILFPERMGQPAEFARLVRHIVENAYLNATTISLDGGARVGTR
ncbi:MAG: SDR family NAD(P)-dependent oxidoreductase [Ottowia sp.]|uniref:SDR family NAD(P)-dependent oxidoreductase n=1 Tax=Ottowia sp. TaxID=1898956 RepID=UPI0039E3D8B6